MSAGGFLYEGEVRHRRSEPSPHAFHYRLFMPYVDVDRLAETFRGRLFWSTRRPNLAWFRRADHLGPIDRGLGDCVRDLVERRIGRRPEGPVRLLTHFRYFGIAMNPISLYYCFDAGERLDAVVAEVSNTPWNERHWYVLDGRRGESTLVRAETEKAFHVSPFLGMHYDYVFQLNEPNERLYVHVANRDRRIPDRRPIFEATLDLRRRPLDGAGLASVLVRHPCMTLGVFAGIYHQAFRLWWKGTPFFSHPGRRPSRDAAPEADRSEPSGDAPAGDGATGEGEGPAADRPLVFSRENES
jgi:DUF1365 family protein